MNHQQRNQQPSQQDGREQSFERRSKKRKTKKQATTARNCADSGYEDRGFDGSGCSWNRVSCCGPSTSPKRGDEIVTRSGVSGTQNLVVSFDWPRSLCCRPPMVAVKMTKVLVAGWWSNALRISVFPKSAWKNSPKSHYGQQKTRVFGSMEGQVSTTTQGEGNWASRLHSVLDRVEPLGTFASMKIMENMKFPLPIVTVQGVGQLSFPLMECAVEPLKVVAEKAPFGKGSETVLDDSVRKAWQIDASQISLGGGEQWDGCLKEAVATACRDLGFSPRRIRELGIHANLFKLLLYETGGHFTPHHDTEKEAGMFGTLVIQLPSLFTGAEFSVWHNGDSKTFELSAKCTEQFKQIAFYADCRHQLHPVTSGVRICLVFNLVTKPIETDQIASMDADEPESSIAPPSHASNLDTESKLRVLANDWLTIEETLPRLGYQLAHEYTPQSFSFDCLKGRDAIVVQTLLNVKTLDGSPLFQVHLMLLERYIKRWDGSADFEVQEDRLGFRIVLDRRGDKVNQEGWDWFEKRSNGWLVPNTWEGKVEEDEHYWQVYDEKYDDGYDDDYGNYCERKHAVFEDIGVLETEEEAYAGNSPGTVESWYYAAAVVFSRTAKD